MSEPAAGGGRTDTAGAGSMREILDILPHRSPFLMVDRVIERRPGHSCLALKRVTFGDPGMRTGHGVSLPELNPFLLVEAMSQTAALAAVHPDSSGPERAVEQRTGRPKVGFLAAVRDFRAERKVVPGDTLEIRAEVIGRFGGLVKVMGTVDVDGERVGSAELTLSVPREVESG